MKKNEYRCTRNTMSLGIDSYKRHGYYIVADTEKQALSIMKKRYPYDKQGFTIDIWRKNVE